MNSKETTKDDQELCPGCMRPIEDCTGQFRLCVKRTPMETNV